MKLRIGINSVIKLALAIIFIALLEPNGIIYSSLHSLMGGIRYLGLFIAVIVFFVDKIYQEKMPMILFFLLLWMGITTYLYSGELDDGYMYTFRTLFTMIILSSFSLKRYPKYFVIMVGTILSLWLLLDGITWKDGGTYITANGQEAFFLGTKTTITYYFVPALVFDYIALKITSSRERKYAKLLNVMALGGTIIYLIREPISTTIVCLVLGALGYVIIANFEGISKAVCKYGFMLTSVLNMCFITGSALTAFRSFFINIMEEGEEMNGRTQIWDMVLEYIEERAIIGYGYASGVKFDVWQEFNTSTHNYFLHILFTMGLVGMTIYILYVFFIHWDNREYMSEEIYRYCIWALVIMNIEAITESYGFNAVTFCTLVTVGYMRKLISIKSTDNQKLGIRIKIR